MGFIEILEKEWPLITGAPVLVLGGAAAVIVASVTITWKLKNSIDEGEVRALREQLQLAKDREADAKEKRDELENQVQELKAKISAGAPKEEIAAASAKVDRALGEFDAANKAVNYVLTAEPGSYALRGGEVSLKLGRVHVQARGKLAIVALAIIVAVVLLGQALRWW